LGIRKKRKRTICVIGRGCGKNRKKERKGREQEELEGVEENGRKDKTTI
jgi:hypothetical protein